MHALVDLMTVLLPVLYGMAAVNYMVYFARRDPFAARTCTPFLFGTFLLHLLFVGLRVLVWRNHPIGTLPEALSLIALAATGVYLYVEKVQQSKNTGAFIVSMVALLQLTAAALLPHARPPSPLDPRYAGSTLFGLHTIAAVLGYTAFMVGAVYGLMFVLLYRDLKRKRFGLIFDRLPSLDVLASMGFGAVLLGWGFLTLTMALGIVMSIKLVPRFYADPKFVSTVLVWLVYAGVISAYFGLGWRGARAVYLSLLGFVFAVVAMLGSVFGWSSFHRFLS